MESVRAAPKVHTDRPKKVVKAGAITFTQLRASQFEGCRSKTQLNALNLLRHKEYRNDKTLLGRTNFSRRPLLGSFGGFSGWEFDPVSDPMKLIVRRDL